MKLYDALLGTQVNTSEMSGARVTIRCQCGRKLGGVYGTGDRMIFSGTTRRFTRAQTANIVMNTALEDVEVCLEAGDEQSASVMGQFFEAANHDALIRILPPLDVPPSKISLKGLPVAVRKAGEDSLKISGGYRVTCRRCQRTYTLVRQLAAWMDDPTPRQIIAADRPGMAKAEIVKFRPEEYKRRVPLYAHLHGVLSSSLQRK